MSVMAKNLQEGARWTFVHSSGKRTGYVYEHLIVPGTLDPKSGFGLSPMHALRNPVTDGLAQVSEKWLCEGRVGNGQHGYWEMGS